MSIEYTITTRKQHYSYKQRVTRPRMCCNSQTRYWTCDAMWTCDIIYNRLCSFRSSGTWWGFEHWLWLDSFVCHLFGVIEVGTWPRYPANTGIPSCSSTHSSSSPRLLCHWGEAVQRPLTPNQACGSHVVTALCVVLALPENGLLTLPSLPVPRLSFVLQEANGHKQA